MKGRITIWRKSGLTPRAALPAAILAATIWGGSGACAQSGSLVVTVTIKPIHALVSQVMEGVGTPRLLIQGQNSPHTFVMRPSDARALHSSGVFFRVSEQTEPFTAKVVKALPQSVKVVTLANAPGLELLDVREGETFEGHSDEHESQHHEGQPRDGHIWLDPENAKAMIAEISRVLSEVAPEHAATWKSNAAKATAEIGALQQEIAVETGPLAAKPFVVFHDAYHYFERRFGLAAIGSITVSPEVQPSAKRLTEIRKKIKTLKAECVFAEPQFQSKLVSTVIEGTGVRAGTLDPEGALVEPGPRAYAALLRNLATGLKSCLVKS